MEIKRKSEKDCGCDNPACCQPKSRPKWIRIISILVLLGALTIVVIKLTGDHTGLVVSSPGSAACCDTSQKNGCDTIKNPGCCPENGN